MTGPPIMDATNHQNPLRPLSCARFALMRASAPQPTAYCSRLVATRSPKKGEENPLSVHATRSPDARRVSLQYALDATDQQTERTLEAARVGEIVLVAMTGTSEMVATEGD